MDAQHSALILIASALEKETLVNMLESEVATYKEAILLNKSEEEIDQAYDKMVFHCHMVLLNKISKNSIDGAIKTMKKMEEVERARDFFTPKTN